MNEKFVYRLIEEDAWRAIAAGGDVPYGPHDHQDGFLHLSTRAQALKTAALYYADCETLLALEIPYTAIERDLKFEPSRDGALFPHLYGVLPKALVARAIPVRKSSDGVFAFQEGRAL